MNPKPYGWHCFIGKGKEEQDFLFINGKGSSMPDASWDKVISLYTHPAKTLTADEITLLVDKIVNPDGCDIFTLIRAVEEAHGIRKAQEK